MTEPRPVKGGFQMPHRADQGVFCEKPQWGLYPFEVYCALHPPATVCLLMGPGLAGFFCQKLRTLDPEFMQKEEQKDPEGIEGSEEGQQKLRSPGAESCQDQAG